MENKKLDIFERLAINPNILNKLKSYNDINKYLEDNVFNLTKFLDDNNIKK